MNIVQPWGTAPTPLLPKCIIEVVGNSDAPQSIKKILGDDATLAALHGTVWEHIDSVNIECLAEIINALRPYLRKIKELYIYSGEEVRLHFFSLPLSTRTSNALLPYFESFTTQPQTFDDVMSLPSVGIKTAIEFACVVESAIETSDQRDLTPQIAAASGKQESAARSDLYSFFEVVSAWAIGEQRLKTIADALPEPLPEWPPEIKTRWSELGGISTGDLAGNELNYYSVPKLMIQELTGMDDKMLKIAEERSFAIYPVATLQELGDKLSITRERVRQIENKTLKVLKTRLGHSGNLPVIRRAESLRNLLGSTVPWNGSILKDALNLVVEDFDENYPQRQLVKLLLMWLAGPYTVQNDWLLIDRKLPSKSIDAMLPRQDERGLISDDTVHKILNGLGINEENHHPWLMHLQIFLQVEDGYIVFRGTFLDKAYSLLKYFDRPMTVEEMLVYIGKGNAGGIKDRLNHDPRFWRINVHNEYVLSGTDGYDEYTNIIDKIIQEIQLCGGQAPYSYLIETLSRKFGVKPNSIAAYMTIPMFEKDGTSVVYIGDTKKVIDPTPHIKKVAGCYLLEDGSWCYRLTINKNVKRGSGCNIPNPFAQQLGCNLGDNIEVTTEFGEITVTWPVTSLSGAYLSTLRAISDEVGADIGDYVFIKATKPCVTFSCLKQEQLESETSKLVKLALLVGRNNCKTEDDALAELASSLKIRQTSGKAILEEARHVLNSRREMPLYRLIQPPTLFC